MPSIDIDWSSLAYTTTSLVAGAFILDYGAGTFVDNVGTLGRRLGVSSTVVALLTAGVEYEELAVIITSIARQHTPLALGNVLGSSVANILFAFALGLLIHPNDITFDSSAQFYTTILLGLTTMSTGLTWAGKLTPATGGILISIFAIYLLCIGYAIYQGIVDAPETSDVESDLDSEDDLESHPSMSERSRLLGDLPYPEDESQRITHSTMYHLTRVVLGLAILSIASFMLTTSAIGIAHTLKLSETMVGFTILAMATTLPGKCIALFGGDRGEGPVVTNTAGSNIFLLTICLGIISASNGVSQGLSGSMSVFELASVWGSSALFAGVTLLEPGRWIGVVLLLGYIGVVVCEFLLPRYI